MAATMPASGRPAGTYTLNVTAKDASGQTIAVSTETEGTVDSVDMTEESAAAQDRRQGLHDG